VGMGDTVSTGIVTVHQVSTTRRHSGISTLPEENWGV